MARDRRRIVYDQDGTVITETPSVSENVSVQKVRRNSTNVEIPVLDAIDTLAAYLLPRFKVEKSPDNPGTCYICGKSTAYQIRHICVDCMDRVSDDLYQKTKAAVEAKETNIIL